ncbi:MAG: carboxypeptidase-like regulatory domain-containing protein [Bacteroidia bacterium]|nr:carboxypeptidase-like regulatory domain-containing protein [Bacteroidia bacterium]
MRYLPLLAFLLFSQLLDAQTIVKGVVTDQKTGEPVTGASVYFLNTSDKTTSNFNGGFTIKTLSSSDTLVIFYVGYAQQKIYIKPGSNVQLAIQLVIKEREFEGVKTTVKVNKALRIVANAQKNKHIYNFEQLNSFECESFTKILIAVNNVSEELKNKRLLKSVEGIFDTISTLSEDKNKQVLPIFLSENLSNFYYNKNPRQNKEVIIASRVKGVGVDDGTFLSQLLGSTFQQYNFNDNILPILEKNFISPISKSSFTYYNYKLVGSDYVNDKKIYQIEVSPKNPLDLVFTGYIWIEDSTYALTRLSLSITNKANLNFVEKLKITQELERTEAGAYVPVKSRILIDIAEISKKSAGMIAVFTNSYEKMVVNKERSSKFYDYPITLMEDATQKSEEFWDSVRHEELTIDEKRALAKIDTLTNIKVIKNYVEFINIIFNGYKNIGKFDLGPYALLYGYNVLEGHRIRVGAKTNFTFSKKFIFSGYGAYGFTDQRWKYKAQAEHIINRKHWTIMGASYKNDVEQIGVTDDYYGASNLFTTVSVFSASQLNRAKESKFWLNSEFMKGWNAKVVFLHKEYQFEPVNKFNFAYFEDRNDSTSKSSDFTNAAITVGLRWAPKEYYLLNDNERVRQSKPGGLALSINFTRGMKGVLGSKFNYNRLTASIEKGLSFGYWGRTDFTLSATKIFETLPYPLLEVHRGNQSFIYTTSAYNQMDFFEFITDQSLFFKMEHHFNGAIFNRIPLMKKLKWREFVEGRAVMGSLSNANLALIPVTDINGIPVTTLKNNINRQPYIEVAYGIENIFKVLQIVAVHRISPLYGTGFRRFGLKMGLSVSF